MYPVKISDNKRYFVDQQGDPFFWMGTTQWELFRGFSLEDTEAVLESARRIGFTVVQVKMMGGGDGIKPNIDGAPPWADNDPLRPDPTYFRHMDAVVEMARAKNINLSIAVFHQRYRESITVQNARAWAKWVSQRYRDVPTIIWSMTPEAKEESFPITRELAAGLREGDGGKHLITLKPDPAPPYTSNFAHQEGWLDFNCIQTWKWVEDLYGAITHDYHLQPTKPVVMAEGAYEAGEEYGYEISPLWVRRQAYYSYLAGAAHSYGHNAAWRIGPNWREALDAPGARQLSLLKGIFLSRPEWWRLVPDQSVFASGGQTEGQVLNLAARHEKGRWVMIYCGGEASFAVDMSKVGGKEVNAFWIDPRTAETVAAGSHANTGTASFPTPSGWEDALLVLEAAG
jgi:hypothetical protein